MSDLGKILSYFMGKTWAVLGEIWAVYKQELRAKFYGQELGQIEARFELFYGQELRSDISKTWAILWARVEARFYG